MAQENSNTVPTWLDMVSSLPSQCWLWIHFWGLYSVHYMKNSKEWKDSVGLNVLLSCCQNIVLQLNEKFIVKFIVEEIDQAYDPSELKDYVNNAFLFRAFRKLTYWNLSVLQNHSSIAHLWKLFLVRWKYFYCFYI